MNIAIAANPAQQALLLTKKTKETTQIIWVQNTEDLQRQTQADVWINCTWQGEPLPLSNKPLLINATANTLAEINAAPQVARFCGWHGFLENHKWEIATSSQCQDDWAKWMTELGWDFLIVKDEPGFIAPRIVSMVINEAYFALQENVAIKKDIDIAMKLGTNYPFGPFEWGQKMGLKNVYHLLTTLAKTNTLYTPCAAIQAELNTY